MCLLNISLVRPHADGATRRSLVWWAQLPPTRRVDEYAAPAGGVYELEETTGVSSAASRSVAAAGRGGRRPESVEEATSVGKYWPSENVL